MKYDEYIALPDKDIRTMDLHSEVLEEFEEELIAMNKPLPSELDWDIIAERLKDHESCSDKNEDEEDFAEIAVATYGGQNVSLECSACYTVILDSDLFSGPLIKKFNS